MVIWRQAVDSLTLLRTFVTCLFVCAMSLLGLTAAFGFEEPNRTLLLLSSSLLVSVPVAVFVHLRVTKALDGSQKRVWFHHLTGRRAPWALAEYLTCDDLRAAARQSFVRSPDRRS